LSFKQNHQILLVAEMLLAEMPVGMQAWMLLETAFFLYAAWRLWAMQRISPSTSPSSLTIPPKRTFLNAWERMGAQGMTAQDIKRKWMMPWFLGCKHEAVIKEGNVVEFVSWNLFSSTVDKLTSPQEEDVRFVLGVMAESGVVFEAGYTAGLQCMRVGFDPVQAIHRPLIVYAIIAMMQQLAAVLLFVAGFRRSTAGGMTYWWRTDNCNSNSSNSSEASEGGAAGCSSSGSIGGTGRGSRVLRVGESEHGTGGHLLFFHGIGVGLLVYLPLLAKLLQGGHYDGAILVEIPALSQVPHTHY
jgi:hypothetical protein